VGATVVVAAGLVAVLGGCDALGSTQDCCGGCPGGGAAVFHLSCSSSDVANVVATGPCATDASLSSYLGNGSVFVQSPNPGVCHVELVFATGFTYSADVTFTSQPGGVCGGPQCKCPDYVVPTSGPFTVDNPNDTCAAEFDAGPEVGTSDAADERATAPRCGSDSDCGPNYACAYPSDGSCSAAGVCVPVTPCGGNGKQPTYCGCDGGSFLRRCDLPGGYSQAPVFASAYPPCSTWDAGTTSDTTDAGAE
jgi:hypothetical protein